MKDGLNECLAVGTLYWIVATMSATILYSCSNEMTGSENIPLTVDDIPPDVCFSRLYSTSVPTKNNSRKFTF